MVFLMYYICYLYTLCNVLLVIYKLIFDPINLSAACLSVCLSVWKNEWMESIHIYTTQFYIHFVQENRLKLKIVMVYIFTRSSKYNFFVWPIYIQNVSTTNIYNVIKDWNLLPNALKNIKNLDEFNLNLWLNNSYQKRKKQIW
jgi:hypothetical protein